MLVIQAENFKQIQTRYRFASKSMVQLIQPDLQTIADHLVHSVVDELAGRKDPKGFVWKGHLLFSVRSKTVSKNEVDVTQAGEGSYLIYGTRGTFVPGGPPDDLLDWCMSKLGLDRRSAWAAAEGILQKGILSPRRTQYPGGNKGFNYPEYIVEDREKAYLTNMAATMANNLVVKYLDT